MSGIVDIFDRAVSHAAATGLFDRVNTHEPKSPPGNGVTCAIWVQNLKPSPGNSGLAATSGYLELRVRLHTNMLQQPEDAIDPNMLTAAITLMGKYSGDFRLSETVKNVDLLGSDGPGLSLTAGYVRVAGQGNQLMRVMDIVLPVIINDLWAQVA
ncbi:MAG: hypothetical protein PVJ28_00240 [Acidimicrobiia bacterium]